MKEFINTVAFLQGLVGSTESFCDEELLQGLKNALLSDNSVIDQQLHHHLRFLAQGQESQASSDFGISLVLVFVCLICAGLASGLTQGLLSLDYMEMTIKSRSGSQLEQEYARRVIPIISHHHLLLVTLMLWNASATEALPIFLNKLVPEYMAIIISVTMVLFVGEIIPASILTGPKQLQIAASLIPLVYVVFFIFFPIAYPISLALDWWLGHDHGMTVYNRTELATLLLLQYQESQRVTDEQITSDRKDSLVSKEEANILGGALKFRETKVTEVMTPVKEAYMLSAKEKLTYKTLYDIFKSGYSRIPVFENDVNDIVGLILAKDLIFVDPQDETPIRNFMELFGRKPAVVFDDQKLGATLALFQKERAHMAIVQGIEEHWGRDSTYKTLGIVTLEDIIEEIIGQEIEDETDAMTETDYTKAAKFRDMDFARLKLLHGKMADETLSENEIKAISAHLFANVPQVTSIYANNMAGLQELVRNSAVLSIKRKSEDPNKPAQDDVLYRRGKPTNTCTLVLNGKIMVLAGKDEFMSEKGPWSTLGADALVLADTSYVPDYTAFIASESVRIVRISMYATHHHRNSFQQLSSVQQSDIITSNDQHPSSCVTYINKGFVGAHSLAERRQSRRKSLGESSTGAAADTSHSTTTGDDESANTSKVFGFSVPKRQMNESLLNSGMESSSSAGASTSDTQQPVSSLLGQLFPSKNTRNNRYTSAENDDDDDDNTV